jgi:purine-cytosine permease-like protein
MGYWSATFVAVIVLEHTYFRHSDFSLYDIAVWNEPKRLPPGVAALGACVLAFGVVVICMNQVWYVGVVARKAGDIGLEVSRR